MNDFPKMLYHDKAEGIGKVLFTDISYVIVQDKEEMELRVSEGWRDCPLAPQPVDTDPEVVFVEFVADEKQPEPVDSLAELKAKAKARGIKLTGKGAETLQREIDEHDAGR